MIYHGDCLELLPDMDPVDVIITDPPWPGSDLQLRRAINADKQNPRRIARIVGMDNSELYRFMTGERGLPFYRAEAVAEAIGMKLVLVKAGN